MLNNGFKAVASAKFVSGAKMNIAGILPGTATGIVNSGQV
jgi:hypothetical protein